ncbi:MAG: S8 family serine peptidase, partial [Myxococcales bacterium]|nr:S8 family serine peptidase [Myxococcales bacterium]
MLHLAIRRARLRGFSSRLVVVLGGVLLGGACETVVAEGGEEATPRGAALSSSVEDACWAVGVITATCEPKDCPEQWICPDVLDDGWLLQGHRMFVDGTYALAGLGLVDDDLPAALQRFCFYRGESKGLVLTEPKLPASVDCPAIAPHANALGKELQASLQHRFEVQVDAEPGALVPGERPVDLALVDTHSDRGWSWDAGHALAMRRIGERIACPTPECSVKFPHALALPLLHDGTPKDPDDGIYGTRGHLAIGIMEAVAEFRARAAEDGEPRRLVVNLSLGWTAPQGGKDCGAAEGQPWCHDHVGELLTRLETGGPPGALSSRYAVEAVHAALLYASCHGALIVAAAGNAHDDSCNLDPVAPAVWASYRAPTVQECEALGFTPPDSIAASLPANAEHAWPLVVPVSAVDGLDRPIAATRPGSITPLVAPGDHVTLDAAEAPLSGTSVSAAAVSGAAALVWSQEHGLDAGAVLRQLYDTAVPVAGTSEFAIHGWAPGLGVRRLSACAAQPLGGSCAAPDALTIATDELATAAADAATASASVHYDAKAIGVIEDKCEACGEPTFAWAPEIPDDSDAAWFFESCQQLAPSFAFDTHHELAGPQPNVPVCPDCPLVLEVGTGQAWVTLSLEEKYLDGSVHWSGANLVLVTDGGKRLVFDLPKSSVLGDLLAGAVVTIELPGNWSDLARATMNAVLVDDATGDE